MKKTLKQLTSLVLCLLLLAGMMTTVGAASETILNDTFNGMGNWYLRNYVLGTDTLSAVSPGADGTGNAAKLYASNGRAYMNGTNDASITFEVGYTYTFTWKMKTEANQQVGFWLWQGAESGIITSPAYAEQIYSATTAWQSYSYTFTVEGFSDGSASKALSPILWLRVVRGSLYVDDFVVTKTPCHKATVTVGENGSVTRDGVAVGSETYVTEGETLTLDIVPNTDYDAVVTVDGEEYTPVNNQIVVTPTADTAINVSFVKGNRETTSLHEDTFTGGKAGWYAHSVTTGDTTSGVSYTTPGADGTGGAVMLTCAKGRPRMYENKMFTWKKGRTYTVTWKMKTDAEAGATKPIFLWLDTAALVTSGGITEQYFDGSSGERVFDVGNEWTEYKWVFTIDNLSDGTNTLSSVDARLAFRFNDVVGNLYVDDFAVYETVHYNDVTVNVGENGSVTKDGEAISSPVKVEKGTSLTLDLVPVSGYQVKAVTVNGAAYTVNNNQIILDSVTEDTVIDVAFEKIPAVAPEIVGGDTSYSWFKAVDGVPTIYTYHKLSAFNTGETDLEYGVKLWNNANAEEKVTLAARSADTEEPVMAEPGAMFAIRAYGTAITSDQTYSVQPYVGDTLGEEMTPKFGE